MRIDVAALAPGVITDGENSHDIAAGSPEQDSAMGPSDFDRAVTVIRGLPDCPSAMVTDDGEALSEITEGDAGGGGEVTGGVLGVPSGGPADDDEVAPHCAA